jgi:intracellular septation protein
LKLVMEEALPLQPEGWMILTRRLTAFFFALAVANEAVWRLMSTEAWVNFKTFGLTAALFLFFMTQGGVLTRYGIEEEKKE